MRPALILFVDDEKAIQRTMVPLLRSRGYTVTTAETGKDALTAIDAERPDLVVLDLGLPDMDGTVVCERIRARSDVPILILSARMTEPDKIAALDRGADDYITKPFSPEELLARVRAALRRALGQEQAVRGRLAAGSIAIDLERREVTVDDREVHLTPKEFDLLSLLAARAGQVVTHRTILRAIWGPHSVDQPEHLRVLVGQLRKKIEDDPARPTRLLTEPWVGYRLADE
jgi:two-component system, OmpR family, KDP operon response regulator KdpE